MTYAQYLPFMYIIGPKVMEIMPCFYFHLMSRESRIPDDREELRYPK